MLVREVMTADPASVQPDTSIKEALGLLAPRTLTLVNAGDIPFQRTRAIYESAGAGNKLVRM